MLIKAKQWAAANFVEGSRPANATIAKWIKKGLIDGQIIDGSPYVEERAVIRQPKEEQPKREAQVGSRIITIDRYRK